MCGIAGIIDFQNRPIDPALVRRMTGAMAHRGPDGTGYFTGDHVSFGHLRLAIIDLSAAAGQPFTDNSGRYTMVFNGEIYNYQEVKPLIGDYDFRTSSDTEMLIAAYAKWGPACLQYLRGMFAFAIWDSREKELFLCRDRMGVKPLYYFRDEGTLVFASEIRAILETGLVNRKLSSAALVDFFTFQSIGYPHSGIEGIFQLEAGTWLKIKNGKEESARYWDLTKGSPDFDFSDAAGVKKRIRELMLQSVERRLVSDVPVGAFLSGGIDSSAVVGLMAEAGGGARPNTFNVSFDEKEFDESGYAEMVARKFDTRHTRIELKPTIFLDDLQNALNAMDVPSGDGINTYIVSKAVRGQGMTVALSGAGGDELFAGYPFFAQYLQLQSMKVLWKLPVGLRKALAGAWPAGKPGGKKDKLLQLLRLPSTGIEQAYPIFRQILSPRLVHELTSLGGIRPAGTGNLRTSVSEQLIARSSSINLLPLISQVSAAEYLGYTQHTLLKDTDQMGMAASLEVREPYFDQDLVEFVLAIPDGLKKPVYPKSLLVESLRPMLPDEIVFRKKQGFLLPWNIWLKNELRSFCDRHIRNMAQRSFIRGDGLLAYWRRFLAGDEKIRWPEIWLFVVLDYWMERNGIS